MKYSNSELASSISLLFCNHLHLPFWWNISMRIYILKFNDSKWIILGLGWSLQICPKCHLWSDMYWQRINRYLIHAQIILWHILQKYLLGLITAMQNSNCMFYFKGKAIHMSGLQRNNNVVILGVYSSLPAQKVIKITTEDFVKITFFVSPRCQSWDYSVRVLWDFGFDDLRLKCLEFSLWLHLLFLFK